MIANWILTHKGTVIPRRSICRLTLDEYSELNEVEMAKWSVFNLDINSKLGDSINLPLMTLPEFVGQDWDAEPFADDEVKKPLEQFKADLVNAAKRPILMHSLTDV